MDPGLISAGIGLLSGAFGRRPSVPGELREQYQLANAMNRRALDLYDKTDLESLDNQAIGQYETGLMDRAMKLLSNYDAQSLANGSGYGRKDTAMDRGRVQIAADTAGKTAMYASNLISTRANRKAALLPNPAGVNTSLQGALAIQNAQSDADSGYLGGLMGLAKALWPKNNGRSNNGNTTAPAAPASTAPAASATTRAVTPLSLEPEAQQMSLQDIANHLARLRF